MIQRVRQKNGIEDELGVFGPPRRSTSHHGRAACLVAGVGSSPARQGLLAQAAHNRIAPPRPPSGRCSRSASHAARILGGRESGGGRSNVWTVPPRAFRSERRAAAG